MKLCNEIIRDLRIDNDFKQSEIADLIGTTQQQYSNYEIGEHDPPLRVLKILAEHYRVSIDYLVGLTSCQQRPDALSKEVLNKYTAGELITDMMSLDYNSRAAVVDYISLQKMRQICLRKKKEKETRANK